MANEKLKAAKDLKNLAAMLSGVLSLGPDLEKLGNVEKEISDLQDRIMALDARKIALTEELDKTLEGVKKAQEEADAILLAAKGDAKDIISAANETAAKKIKAVKDDIDLMRQQGQVDLTLLESQISAKAVELKDAQIAVSNEQEKLIKFQRMVADLRNKVGAIA